MVPAGSSAASGGKRPRGGRIPQQNFGVSVVITHECASIVCEL